MLSMTFQNIQDWLVKNAPKISQYSLNHPVDLTTIQAFEQQLGHHLPESFKALYQWHNGMNDEHNLGSLFYAMQFLSLSEIKVKYQDQIELSGHGLQLEYTDPQIKSENAHHQDWLIFAHDGGRTGLYLDFTPTEQGQIGQVIFIDHDYDVGILVANNLDEFLQQFAADLQDELYELDAYALDDEQHFLSCNVHIDLLNWHQSERWSRPMFA